MPERRYSYGMNNMRQPRSRRLFSSLLLMSVVCFSVGSSAHWLWHEPHESCRDTAHSCRNESLGNRTSAWQIPAHAPVDFDRHGFQCPVCSGLLAAVEAPEGMHWAASCLSASFAPAVRLAPDNRRDLLFSARAPPCLG